MIINIKRAFSIALILLTLVFCKVYFSTNNVSLYEEKITSPPNKASAKISSTSSQSNDTHINVSGFEETTSINFSKVYKEIESRNYKSINSFHGINALCSSVASYDQKHDYLVDNYSYGEEDEDFHDSLYEKCKNIKVKDFDDLIELYTRAINDNQKEAEYYLAITYPPMFKSHYEWLSKSASWNKQSIKLLSNVIDNSEVINNKQKLFWSKVYINTFPSNNEVFLDRIEELSTSLDEVDKLEVDSLIQDWLTSPDEISRRIIIQDLNTGWP
ncbi:hypothetical protein [Agaribacterium haliotis]|uniref:hypothetical protein n=1 Tax=Agaribacterium haliotis TaxID=2013869 RepID=UPI000BB56C2E|nr:hypothetical protein [Agaribacterium haliotis]